MFISKKKLREILISVIKDDLWVDIINMIDERIEGRYENFSEKYWDFCKKYRELESEKWIDEIISRIKRKQLK